MLTEKTFLKKMQEGDKIYDFIGGLKPAAICFASLLFSVIIVDASFLKFLGTHMCQVLPALQKKL